MLLIGYSTGSLAKGDFRKALSMLESVETGAVELSSLRDTELMPLVNALPTLAVDGFQYVSFHAPVTFNHINEADVIAILKAHVPVHWPIIVHPDCITLWEYWASFGEQLCVENMDKRKPFGRTVKELDTVFEKLPDASFCFDIGHARQVDPTMSQASQLLKAYSHRLKELHVSEVNARSGHEPMSFTAINSFRQVASLIPEGIPLILETPVKEAGMQREIDLAKVAFTVEQQPVKVKREEIAI